MSAVLGILFFGLIVWGSFEPTLHAIASGEYEGEGALRVPAWPARIIVLIGSAAGRLQLCIDRDVRRRAAGDRPGGRADTRPQIHI